MRQLFTPKRLTSALLAMLLTLSVAFSTSTTLQSEETEISEDTPTTAVEDSDSFEAIFTEDGRTLMVHPTTTEIALRDDASGTMWYSNPQTRSDDPIANGQNLARLSSQLTVTYFTATGQEITKDNYFDAIRLGQFEIETVGEELKITYTIGEQVQDYRNPLAMASSKYEAFFDALDSSAQRLIRRRYTEYTAEDASSEMLEMYPGLQEQSFYILRDNIQEHILGQISEVFEEAGYTAEQKAEDKQEAGIESTVQDVLNVQVSMYYSLDQGDLLVRIPYQEIQFDEAFPVTQLRVLEMFGAAGVEDEGYMFIPDGSGALIHNNNGKLSTNQYLSSVYGVDYAMRQSAQVGIPEQIALPVFGGVSNDQAFLGIIESGAAKAAIRADISGRVNSYNTVHPIFRVLTQDRVNIREIAGNNVIQAYQQHLPEGDIQIRYRFLMEDDANYSGMARSYQDYLVNKGAFTPLNDSELPLQLEILSAIDKNRPILGIPANRIQPLTTFDEASQIANRLKLKGVHGMDIRLSGWTNGGLKQSLPNSMNPLRGLGSGDDLEDLAAEMQSMGYGFYPDQTFSFVRRNRLFDRFLPSRDASRFLDREIVQIAPISPATMMPLQTHLYWLLSPAKGSVLLGTFADELHASLSSGLSIRDLGKDLGSDFNRDAELDREAALDLWTDALTQQSNNGLPMMFEYGNGYVLPHANIIIDTPSQSSQYQLTDESIPFLQMVLHGYVDYSLSPINLSNDWEDHLLQSIAVGASPRFVVMEAEGSVLKNTQYTNYFSVNYSLWEERITDSYTRSYEALNGVRTSPITMHEWVSEGVAKVSYENGTVVWVNQNNEDYEAADQTIPARDFMIEGGQDE